MQIYKTAYNAPIGYSGLRAGLDYTNLYYKIGKELSNLDAKGTAQIAGANLSYPLIRQRDTNLQATVGWDYKAMRDQSNGIVVDNKRVEVWNLGVSGNSRDGFLTGGLNYYSVAILLGRLNLSRVPNSIILDQATAKTNGSYNKFTYNFVRLQRLINNFSFFTAVNGQFAGKDLDSSEKFLLGGPTGVRAYPTGEASGDDGWVTNVELRYDVPLITKLGVLQLVGFYDIGGIARYRNTWDGWNSGIPNEPNHYTLSGAGLGVNLLKGTNYAVRVSYAWTIGDNPGRSLSGANSDGKHKTGMLWVQLIINF